MPVFLHRVFSYSPCKPRHPLLRVLVGLLGLALLLVLVAVGLVVGVGMLLFAAARRLFRARPAAEAGAPGREGVIEGEYLRVDKPGRRLGLR